MFKGIAISFNAYFKAIGLIFSSKLWLSFIFPLIISIFLYYLGIELKQLINAETNLIIKGYFIKGLDLPVVSYIVSGMAWIIINVLFFLFFAYFLGFIVLILMSPALAFVSEKTEKIITGKEYYVSFAQIVKDMFRGLLISLRNMFLQMFWTILIIIVGLFLNIIPILGTLFSIIVIPAVLLYITAFFYGFSFMDYAFERRKMNVRQSIYFVRKNRWATTVIGLVFALFLLIPFCNIGILFAGWFAIISSVAATITVIDIEKTAINLKI